MAAWNIYRARKAERRHPPAGRFLPVEGVRLHYLEQGEGPPAVLLHGDGVTVRISNEAGCSVSPLRGTAPLPSTAPVSGIAAAPQG